MGHRLLSDIEQFQARTRLSDSRIGRIALGDPRFIEDLRNGRSPTGRTDDRVRSFLDGYDRLAPLVERLRGFGLTAPRAVHLAWTATAKRKLPTRYWNALPPEARDAIRQFQAQHAPAEGEGC